MNTVVIAGRRITLRPNSADRPGRTVAYRSLPAEATAGEDRPFTLGGSSLRRNARNLRSVPPDKGPRGDRVWVPLDANAAPASAPESRRITDHGLVSGRMSSGGALPGFPTSLDTGLPPKRIRRHTQAADRGAVGPGTSTGRTGALGFNADTNGSVMTIPHIRIPRTPITVTAFRRTIDFTSSIPARGIGAPVR